MKKEFLKAFLLLKEDKEVIVSIKTLGGSLLQSRLETFDEESVVLTKGKGHKRIVPQKKIVDFKVEKSA